MDTPFMNLQPHENSLGKLTSVSKYLPGVPVLLVSLNYLLWMQVHFLLLIYGHAPAHWLMDGVIQLMGKYWNTVWTCHDDTSLRFNIKAIYVYVSHYNHKTVVRSAQLDPLQDCTVSLHLLLCYYVREFCDCGLVSDQLLAFVTLLKTILNTLWLSDAIWRHKCGSTLAQVMACSLIAPSLYLNQCWLISELLWHSPESSSLSVPV